MSSTIFIAGKCQAPVQLFCNSRNIRMQLWLLHPGCC